MALLKNLNEQIKKYLIIFTSRTFVVTVKTILKSDF